MKAPAIDRDGGVFRFRLVFPSPDEAPGVVVALVETMTAFLEEQGVPPADINRLGIAAEELLTNLSKYGDAGGRDLIAAGSVTPGEESIVFRIEDNSAPFDPRGRTRPNLSNDPMERAVGGLGLFMLSEMFSGCRYVRLEGGNASEWILHRMRTK